MYNSTQPNTLSSSDLITEKHALISDKSHEDNPIYVSTTPQVQESVRSPIAGVGPLINFSDTAGISSELLLSIQNTGEVSSENISSFEEFCKHPSKLTIPINPAILSNKDLIETSALYQNIYLNDNMGSICQEIAYLYPESPLL